VSRAGRAALLSLALLQGRADGGAARAALRQSAFLGALVGQVPFVRSLVAGQGEKRHQGEWDWLQGAGLEVGGGSQQQKRQQQQEGVSDARAATSEPRRRQKGAERWAPTPIAEVAAWPGRRMHVKEAARAAAAQAAGASAAARSTYWEVQRAVMEPVQQTTAFVAVSGPAVEAPRTLTG
jgi:hypothetical protein